MIPAKVLEAKKTPGIYLLHGIHVFFVKITLDKKVWQLNPHDFAITGELSDEGWHDNPATQNMRVFRLEEI
jgi:hypothetical protein